MGRPIYQQLQNTHLYIYKLRKQSKRMPKFQLYNVFHLLSLFPLLNSATFMIKASDIAISKGSEHKSAFVSPPVCPSGCMIRYIHKIGQYNRN